MKLNMILVGGSMLAMFGAVGAIENNAPLTAPLVVIAIAVVAGAIGALRIRNEGV